MLLAYIDESGVNYSKRNRYWTDGPYSLWTGILVSDRKYFHIERAFPDLTREFLGQKATRREFHAYDIWNSRERSSRRDEKVRKYFEELIQLAAKLRIQVIFGVQQKNPNFRAGNIQGKARELRNARYSLLTLLEHQLGKMDETAVIVSDDEVGGELKELVFQRTKWRYSPPGSRSRGLKPKFLFEYRSNFILDQLHYVDSKDSLLIQFSDHISYILKRVLEHLYLMQFPGINKPSPDIRMVPITEGTFNTFASFCKIKFANYDQNQRDVMMGNLSDLTDVRHEFQSPPSGVGLFTAPSMAKQIIKSFTPFG